MYESINVRIVHQAVFRKTREKVQAVEVYRKYMARVRSNAASASSSSIRRRNGRGRKSDARFSSRDGFSDGEEALCSLRVFESVMYIAQQERDIHLGWEVWRDMQEHGLRPPERVVSSMVDLAGHTRNWAMGKAVFEEYLSRLDDTSTTGDCGAYGEEEREPVQPNVVIFNAAINAAVCSSQPDAAARIFAEMGPRWHVSPTAKTYTSLIRGYAIVCDASSARRAFEDMVEAGVQPNAYALNTLLLAYQKTGLVDEAERLLRDPRIADMEFDVVTHTTMLAAYASAAQYERGFAAVRSMMRAGVRPNSFTYATLARMCQATGRWEQLHITVSSALKMNLAPDQSSCRSVLGALKRENTATSLQCAVDIFTLLQRERIRLCGKAYGCMIAFLCIHRQENVALKLETAIRESGVPMDTRLYNLLLNAASYACTRSRPRGHDAAGGAAMAVDAAAAPVEAGSGAAEGTMAFESSVFAARTSKAGLYACFELYGSMLAEGQRPDIITLNILMRTIAVHLGVRRSISFLAEYRRRGLEPDQRTYCTVIRLCTRAGDGRSALSIFNLMRERGVRLSHKSYNDVLSSLAAAGLLSEAEAIYGEIFGSDEGLEVNYEMTETEAIMICVFAELGKASEALALLEHHLLKVVARPRAIIFEEVMRAMYRAQRPADTVAVFRMMLDAGTCPNRPALDLLAAVVKQQGSAHAEKAFEEMVGALRSVAGIPLRPYWTLIRSSCTRETQWLRAFTLYDEIVRRNVARAESGGGTHDDDDVDGIRGLASHHRQGDGRTEDAAGAARETGEIAGESDNDTERDTAIEGESGGDEWMAQDSNGIGRETSSSSSSSSPGMALSVSSASPLTTEDTKGDELRSKPIRTTVRIMVDASIRYGRPDVVDRMLATTAEYIPQHLGRVLETVVDAFLAGGHADWAINAFFELQRDRSAEWSYTIEEESDDDPGRILYSTRGGGLDKDAYANAKSATSAAPMTTMQEAGAARLRLSMRCFIDLVHACVNLGRADVAHDMLASISHPSSQVCDAFNSILHDTPSSSTTSDGAPTSPSAEDPFLSTQHSSRITTSLSPPPPPSS